MSAVLELEFTDRDHFDDLIENTGAYLLPAGDALSPAARAMIVEE